MGREIQPFLNPETFFVLEVNEPGLDAQLHLGYRYLLATDTDIKNLRSRISTDGIFPTAGAASTNADDISKFALSGIPGINVGDLEQNHFGVLVVGPFFGGGSARHQAVDTLSKAGIHTIIVVGGHTERIFKENCFNSGGPEILEISSDPLELNHKLSEIRNGTLNNVNAYGDPIRSEIKQSGGLFEYTKKRLANLAELPVIFHPELPANHPMTAAQKILAGNMINLDPSHPVVIPGDVGFVKTSLRFAYELTSPSIEQLTHDRFQQDIPSSIKDPDSIALFEDHTAWSDNPQFAKLRQKQRQNSSAWGVKLYSQKPGLDGSLGICHSIIKENCLALPGQYLIGTDSHTCSAGALNAYAEGVGAGTMANSFQTKDNLVVIPESIRVNFTGKLPAHCSAKDVMLKLLSHPLVKTGAAIDKALEYSGAGLKNWSLDDLFVLANMSVEAGAATGIVTEVTQALVNHISAIKNLPLEKVVADFIRSDPKATFAYTIDINLDELEPMVATPGHPTNGTPVSRLPKTPITSAYIGSCTGGNLTDLQAAAAVLKDHHIKIPLVVQPASMSIYHQVVAAGLDQIFIQAGAQFLTPGCGACIGLGPGKAENPTDVILMNTNRNWPGRTGHEQASIYLAGPSVVAASSIAGYICSPDSTT